MNKIMLSGRTTSQYVLSTLPNEKQTKKGSFGFAVDRPKGSKQTVDYFNCEVFGPIAEIHSKYIKVGSKLNIIGAMHIDRDLEIPTKIYPKIIIEEIEYQDKKEEE